MFKKTLLSHYDKSSYDKINAGLIYLPPVGCYVNLLYFRVLLICGGVRSLEQNRSVGVST